MLYTIELRDRTRFKRTIATPCSVRELTASASARRALNNFAQLRYRSEKTIVHFATYSSSNGPIKPRTMPDIALESLAPIREVPLTLRAELGRRSISGNELMNLHPGSVLELSTLAGENVSLFIEDVALGTGEVLVTNNSLAIRVAELTDKIPDTAQDGKARVE